MMTAMAPSTFGNDPDGYGKNCMTSPAADLEFMQRAIDASRAALDAGDRPYGAVLASADGDLLHVARNRQATDGDCTAHAETVLVREATARLGAAALCGATVYASGEPCAMCSGALFWAGVRRVVYAVPADAMGALLGGDLLPVRCADVLRGATPPVRVDGPLLAEEAATVLRDAVARQRG
jgi:tRNA(adenine34) deaminase